MFPNHDEHLRDWKANAEREDEKNYRFLRSLKVLVDGDRVDAVARRLHERAFSHLDCTQCANCCKTMRVALTDEDIVRIAEHLAMNRAEFISTYLEEDAQERGYRIKQSPCVFLGEDNRCTIYSVRPMDCQDFPNTNKEGFTFRTHAHAANCVNCPAVYYIVKRMRKHFKRS